jgi:GNAT superfamily N-acetyltransferase
MEMINLWNKEFGAIYPISEALLRRNVIDNVDVLKEGSYTVIDYNNHLVGFIVAKGWRRPGCIPNYDRFGWISILYVAPQERKKGIGSELLRLAEKEILKNGKSTIHVGRDYNNFFPGIPFDMKSSFEWFKNRGYLLTGETNDLIRKVTGGSQKIDLEKINYEVRLAGIDDQAKILNFMEKNFPGRWFYETHDYFQNGGTGKEYLIMLDHDKVIAFTRINDHTLENHLINYNMTWRNRFSALGGIGPLGVDVDYRHQNFGFHIVAEAVNILIDRKVSDIIIDWTSLLDFYRKFGFEVWKSYKYCEKGGN